MAPTFGNSTVCIVDDDEAVRDSLRILLECEGYTVRDFASGRALLAEISDITACCILLDLHMAEMDGFAVMAVLRQQRVQIPIIVFTGHGSAKNKELVRQAGALAMLDKPVRDQDLLDALRTVCEDSQSSDA